MIERFSNRLGKQQWLGSIVNISFSWGRSDGYSNPIGAKALLVYNSVFYYENDLLALHPGEDKSQLAPLKGLDGVYAKFERFEDNQLKILKRKGSFLKYCCLFK